MGRGGGVHSRGSISGSLLETGVWFRGGVLLETGGKFRGGNMCVFGWSYAMY